MSTPANWQSNNMRYLTAAVAWVRTLLERQARLEHPVTIVLPPSPPPPPAEPPAPPEEVETLPFWERRRRKPAHQLPPSPPPRLFVSGQPPSAAEGHPTVEQAAADLAAASETTPSPAALMLAQRLGLSAFERDVLLLCAALELDTGLASLCGLAQGDPNRPYPTFALAFTLFNNSSWDALSPERPLRYWRLIEINQPAGLALTVSSLRADERIVSYLKGLNYLDDRMSPLLTIMEEPQQQEEQPLSQQNVARRIVDYLKQQAPGQSLPVVQLLGTDAMSKQAAAIRVAGQLGLRVYRLPAVLLPAQAAELETLTRLWQRESLLLPMALYLDGVGSEIDTPQAGPGSPVHRLLSRAGSILFVDTRDVLPGLADNSFVVDVGKPTAAEQLAAWEVALASPASQTPPLLAGQFNLSLPAIHQIARQATTQPAPPDQPLHDRLWSACLAATRPRLDTLAQRIDPKATWDDFVLPPAETALLHQISAQVGQRSKVYESWGFNRKMSRGFGISALFAGDTGTGKTMAAEVIANQLRLNLYRIDLSAVVSKYIGETEKNLRRLFDAAEDGGAILFFDEADALFGKRSEVKDSHDRYANIEINYLLQRMESYGGLAILATNLKSALDTAFMRRLRFVVNFPFPGVAERKAMWAKAFPQQTPVQDLDVDRLARLNLTGGNIACVALNAAFHAAQAGGPVTMPVILDAARTELRKLGRVVNELEFRGQGRTGNAA